MTEYESKKPVTTKAMSDARRVELSAYFHPVSAPCGCIYMGSERSDVCAKHEHAEATEVTAVSLRDLQDRLPWRSKYSADFEADPRPHKHFAHALHHVAKALGKLTELEDDLDHGSIFLANAKSVQSTSATGGLEHFLSGGKYIADLVILAVRLANEFPTGPLDLDRAVRERVEEKNGVKL